MTSRSFSSREEGQEVARRRILDILQLRVGWKWDESRVTTHGNQVIKKAGFKQSDYFSNSVHEDSFMATSLFCTAKSDDIARTIVEELKVSGVSKKNVSVLFPDRDLTAKFAHDKHTELPIGIADGVAGVLMGLGITKIGAIRYEKRIHAGSILISVHDINNQEANHVKEIFKDNGTDDIAEFRVIAVSSH